MEKNKSSSLQRLTRKRKRGKIQEENYDSETKDFSPNNQGKASTLNGVRVEDHFISDKAGNDYEKWAYHQA